MALRVLLYCLWPIGTAVELFFLLNSQHVDRMAGIFFSEVSVINRCLMIFGMILISSSALLPRIASANEVIYFG